MNSNLSLYNKAKTMFITRSFISVNKLIDLMIIGVLFALPYYNCINRPISGDALNYYIHFLLAQENICVIEPSFFVLSKFFSLINSGIWGFRFVLTFYATLDVIILFKLLKKSSIAILGFIIFYFSFYNWMMCVIMRAGLAYMISLLAFYYLECDKKKFFLLICFAAFFHVSVIFFLVMIPLSNYSKNRNRLLKIPILSIFIAIVIAFVFNVVFTKISVNNYIFNKISGYYTTGIYKLNLFSLKSMYLFFLYYLFYFFIPKEKLKEEVKAFYLLLSTSFFLHFLGAFVIGEIGSRLRDFVYISQIVSVPMFIKNANGKLLFTIMIISIVLFFSIYEGNFIL